MFKQAVVALMIAGGGVVAGFTAATASAAPGVSCEARGFAHVDRHGGQVADDAFHREHGERVTCPKDKSKDRVADTHPEEERRTPHTLDGDKGDHHFGRDRHRWWRND